jgi:hypothetical protein
MKDFNAAAASTPENPGLTGEEAAAVSIIDRLVDAVRAELGFSSDDTAFERKRATATPEPHQSVITPFIVCSAGAYEFGVEATSGTTVDIAASLTRATVPTTAKDTGRMVLVSGWALSYEKQGVYEFNENVPTDDAIVKASVKLTEVALDAFKRNRAK